MADAITGVETKNIVNERLGFVGQIATKFIDYSVEPIVDGDLEYRPPDGYVQSLISTELAAGSAGQVTVVGFTTDDLNEIGSSSTQIGGEGRTDWQTKGFRRLRLELRGNNDDAFLSIQSLNIAL